MATPGLSIPDLLKIVRHSVCETEFNEVQQILTDRDKMMKMELEDLKRDFDSMKTEACLQERYHSLAEFENIRMEEKLQLSERKCVELNEEITRLKEELKISLEGAKKAEERKDTVSHEFYKMISEKNKTILDLNAKISELQSRNLEMNEQLVVELRRKQSEADNEVAELKRQNFEATQKLEERVMKMESGMGNMLNVNTEDLAGLAAFIDKFAAANGENLYLSDMIKVWKDSLTTDNTDVDPESIAIVSDVACGTSKAVASDDTPLVMEGGIKVVQPCNKSRVIVDPRAPALATAPAGYISGIVVGTADNRQSSGQQCGKRRGGYMGKVLETKKRRVLRGGGHADDVHTCEICNVVCNSGIVFNSHLAGKKHASMLKKRAL